jgi:ribonuclease E
MEAAEEIVRQLRLRDVGGIIVIDFIDMVLESNRDLVLRRLTECLGRDRTKHQVAEVTSLGLVQMTRKRVGQGLLEVFSEPCDHCRGRGVIVSTDPVDEKRRSGGSAGESPARGSAGSAAGGGNSRRDRSGPKDSAPREDPARDDAAKAATDETGPSDDAASTTEPGDGESARTGGRRSRGRRGRGQSGEERAAEDAAVLAGGPSAATGEAIAVDAPGTPDEMAEYRSEDSSEDLPPAAQTPVESSTTAAIVETSDASPVEPVAVETGSVDAPEEINATGRPRRRRAASRPAGPPV